MADDVYATPAEVRGLAQDIALGIKALIDLNEHVLSGLNKLSLSFRDEGFEVYGDAVTAIQEKLANIAEDELVVTVSGLTEFANQLEAAQNA